MIIILIISCSNKKKIFAINIEREEIPPELSQELLPKCFIVIILVFRGHLLFDYCNYGIIKICDAKICCKMSFASGFVITTHTEIKTGKCFSSIKWKDSVSRVGMG